MTSFCTNWCDLECLDEDAFFSLSNFFDSHIWLYQLMDDYISNLQKEKLILGGALRSYFSQQNL